MLKEENFFQLNPKYLGINFKMLTEIVLNFLKVSNFWSVNSIIQTSC